MRKAEGEKEKDNAERWLLTYSDLITLLMIFFIVLYSMSKIDADKFRAIADSLNKALGGGNPSQVDIAISPQGPSLFETGYPGSRATQPGKSDNQDNTANTQYPGQGQTPQTSQAAQASQGNTDLDNMTIAGIKAKIDRLAADNGIQTKLVTSIEERGLVVSIQDTLLFDSGSAVITPHAQAIIAKIATVLAPAPNYIKVEGHTDNLPIHTPQFPSNWELSVLRATNVVQLLIAPGGIAPDRLSATGYGEYRPVAANDTEAGRSRNRRVDLVILRSKYDLVEPGKTQAPAATAAQGTATTP